MKWIVILVLGTIEALVIGFASGWSTEGAAVFQAVGMLTVIIGAFFF